MLAMVVSAGIRFITYLPFFFMVFWAVPDYMTMKQHPVLLHPPYKAIHVSSMACAAAVSIIGVIWVFLSWMPSFAASGPIMAVYLLFDGAMVALFMVVLIDIPTYTPVLSGACKHHNMSAYGAPPGHLSIFAVTANMTTANHTTLEFAAQQVCSSYSTTWAFSLFLVICFIIVLPYDVMLLLSKSPSSRNGRYYSNSNGHGLLHALSCGLIRWPWWRSRYPKQWLKALPLIVLDLLVAIPTAFVAVMPNVAQRKLWYSIRVAEKASTAAWEARISSEKSEKHSPRKWSLPRVNADRHQTEMQLLRRPRMAATRDSVDSTHSFKTAKETVTAMSTGESRLINLLNYDILVLLSSHLHFADILSLSMTSKAMHHQVFPPNSRAYRTQQMRMYTCGSSEGSCDSCGMPVCEDCSAGPNSTFWSYSVPADVRKRIGNRNHALSCKPHCASCWSSLCNTSRRTRRRCICVGTSYGSSSQIPGMNWKPTICDGCAKHVKGYTTDYVPQQAQERRDMVIHGFKKRNLKQCRDMAWDDLSCHACTRSISGSGPRWWVCANCNLECRESCHPGWGKKKEMAEEDG